MQIHNTSPGEIAFEGARGLLLDLSPRRIGDRGKLAVEIIHQRRFPLREPMPREPSDIGEMDGEGSAAGDADSGSAAGVPGVTSSKNVAEGTKKRLPVTARLKSKIRS